MATSHTSDTAIFSIQAPRFDIPPRMNSWDSSFPEQAPYDAVPRLRPQRARISPYVFQGEEGVPRLLYAFVLPRSWFSARNAFCGQRPPNASMNSERAWLSPVPSANIRNSLKSSKCLQGICLKFGRFIPRMNSRAFSGVHCNPERKPPSYCRHLPSTKDTWMVTCSFRLLFLLPHSAPRSECQWP